MYAKSQSLSFTAGHTRDERYSFLDLSEWLKYTSTYFSIKTESIQVLSIQYDVLFLL